MGSSFKKACQSFCRTKLNIDGAVLQTCEDRTFQRKIAPLRKRWMLMTHHSFYFNLKAIIATKYVTTLFIMFCRGEWHLENIFWFLLPTGSKKNSFVTYFDLVRTPPGLSMVILFYNSIKSILTKFSFTNFRTLTLFILFEIITIIFLNGKNPSTAWVILAHFWCILASFC